MSTEIYIRYLANTPPLTHAQGSLLNGLQFAILLLYKRVLTNTSPPTPAQGSLLNGLQYSIKPHVMVIGIYLLVFRVFSFLVMFYVIKPHIENKHTHTHTYTHIHTYNADPTNNPRLFVAPAVRHCGHSRWLVRST